MSHDTLRVRLLAFLFLIPLALYAWSAVQAFRVDSTLRDEQFMRDWSASARNDPDAADAIPRHLFRPAYGVEGHLHQFAEDAEAIRRDHPWLALRGWLAAIGKLCALASALVAAALLARLEYDGRRSMRSQAYLLGHLAPAWRRLGRLVPLHAGLLVAALASQLLYEALWSYSHWHSHGFVALLFSLPLWLLFLGGLLDAAAPAPRTAAAGGTGAPPARPRTRPRRRARPLAMAGTDRRPRRSAAAGPCRHRHRALLLRHPGQGPAGAPRHSAGGAYPVHPADLRHGHERGRKRRDHRPRTGPSPPATPPTAPPCRSCSGRCACASNASPHPRMGVSACSASRACGPRCTSSNASSAPTCTGIATRNWPPTRSGRG
ncbi:hypothetical protein P4054_25500 [Pseudomonas aeruginosa]|nr:hypothetical protein [Pseudomonas aeruginosa]